MCNIFTELGKMKPQYVHSFSYSHSIVYSSDNIPIGPNVCLSEERHTHAVKRPAFIRKCVYDW